MLRAQQLAEIVGTCVGFSIVLLVLTLAGHRWLFNVHDAPLVFEPYAQLPGLIELHGFTDLPELKRPPHLVHRSLAEARASPPLALTKTAFKGRKAPGMITVVWTGSSQRADTAARAVGTASGNIVARQLPGTVYCSAPELRHNLCRSEQAMTGQ
jgi:hypothetical protein